VFRKLVEQNAKRHDEIKQQLTDATTAQAEAEAVLEEFTRKLAAFDRERDALMAKTEAKAQATSKRILEEARAEAEKIRVISIAAAEREVAARRLEIEREIIDQAITKAEAILVSQFSEMDQRRIVDDYVERVANAPLAAGGRAS
jgi:F0F1-type ATP synthase membrane subunit b/b'